MNIKTVVANAVLTCVNFVISFFSLYNLKLTKQDREINLFYGETSSILLVTAHPDDEAIFFVPSFETLSLPENRNYLLSISNGNADGKGRIREKELEKSCESLHIEHHHVVHDPKLQDGYENVWDPDLIAHHVINYVKEKKIENILTFDEYGIEFSLFGQYGHPNHAAVYHGVKKALTELPGVEGWKLISTPRIRKFFGLLDFYYYYFFDKDDNIDNFTFFTPRLLRSHIAITQHHTQCSLKIKLTNLLSRYSFVNGIQRIKD